MHLQTLVKSTYQNLRIKLMFRQDARDILETSIAEHPPITVKEGGVIKDGYDEKLDTYRDAAKNGKEWLAKLEQEERERTGIKNLRLVIIGFLDIILKSRNRILIWRIMIDMEQADAC